MLKTTEGIVLKNKVFGEADLIVTYFSKDYGIIQTLAKSPRKIKSRFGSSLEPLTHSRIAFLGKEHATLPKLTRSDIITTFQNLREDYHCFNELSLILRMNLSLIQDRTPVDELFTLLNKTLYCISSGVDRALCLLYYKMRFLKITGYMPSLDVCGRCGATIKTTARPLGSSAVSARVVHDFYVEQGAIVCMRCCANTDSSITISGNALSFYLFLRDWDIERLGRIKAPQGLVAELSHAINAHIKGIGH